MQMFGLLIVSMLCLLGMVAVVYGGVSYGCGSVGGGGGSGSTCDCSCGSARDISELVPVMVVVISVEVEVLSWVCLAS